MPSGLAIYRRVCTAANPTRAVQTLSNRELVTLLDDLEGPGWADNWIAAQLMVDVVGTAVGRFRAEVDLAESE